MEWRPRGDKTRATVSRGIFCPACCAPSHIHSSLLTFFLYFYVLFHSFCSHAQVFRKILVHESHISYSHTEWNLLSSLSEKVGKTGSSQSAVNPKLHMCANLSTHHSHTSQEHLTICAFTWIVIWGPSYSCVIARRPICVKKIIYFIEIYQIVPKIIEKGYDHLQ